MSVSQEIATPVDVTVESMALVPRNVFLGAPMPVCRNDLVRKKVNDLLATGASYAFIVRALGDDNAELDKRDLVTIDSVRNHCERHFPVQQVARPPTGTSWSAGLRRTRSTSSKVWPPRLLP